MLNRRILRVKAMQALYSYQISEQSLKEVINETLVAKYALDPAIHDFTEKELFETRQRQISEVFFSNLKSSKVAKEVSLEQEIKQDIQASMDQFYTKLDAEKRRIKKEMMAQAASIYDWYVKLLMVPGELAFAETQEKDRIQKSSTLKDSQKYFPLDSSIIIQRISTSKELQQYSLENKIDWKSQIDDIRTWYKELIRKDENYLKLVEAGKSDAAAELNFILHFYKQLFFKSDLTLAFMTDQLLHWEDDAPILKNMITKTLKTLEPEAEDTLVLRPLSINQEDDFEYFAELFSETVRRNDEVEKYIEKKAKNWDMNRISATDMIILKMAITEMIIFPSIPVKVTINEFIEISKQYSTPKSKQFINGILDVLANELTSEGIVKKSGRGLIDNK